MVFKLIVIGVIAMILFGIAWRIMFGTRTRKTEKATKKAHSGVKSRISISSNRARNERLKTVSQMLNFIPIGRLTPQKREEINRRLATVNKGSDAIRIAEEIHVLQWSYTFLYLVFCCFIIFFIWKGALLLVLGTPIVFNIPMGQISLSTADEEDMLEEQFQYFFSTYYVQYKRLGTSLQLSDVVQSYKNIAPYEMQTFVSRLEVDLASGEAHALKMLDRRYCHNPDVHRFCALAATVSRGDARADKIVESFQTELEHKSIERRRAIVRKRMEMVEKVQGLMLYGIVTCLLVVVFIHVAMG